MKPSPFALQLMDDVRPILRNIQRVLSPREAFVGQRSTRTFRLAVPDSLMSVFPPLWSRIQNEAPHAQVEWTMPHSSTLLELSDELIDLVILPSGLPRPDGVSAAPLGNLEWMCFSRRGHPALQDWSAAQWAAWPNVAVSIGSRVSPVTAAAAMLGIERQVAISVPNFATIASLLSRTDLLATLPAVVLTDSIERFDLVATAPPFEISAMPHAMLWSSRLMNDPANSWLRSLFLDVVESQIQRSHRLAAS